MDTANIVAVKYDDLTWKERLEIRKKYVEAQKGVCYYCKEPLEGPPPIEVTNNLINKRFFPENFFKYPVHLHHNRKTGLTIGAVHAYCNAYLWQYLHE